jgi:hypothetical protein
MSVCPSMVASNLNRFDSNLVWSFIMLLGRICPGQFFLITWGVNTRAKPFFFGGQILYRGHIYRLIQTKFSITSLRNTTEEVLEGVFYITHGVTTWGSKPVSGGFKTSIVATFMVRFELVQFLPFDGFWYSLIAHLDENGKNWTRFEPTLTQSSRMLQGRT